MSLSSHVSPSPKQSALGKARHHGSAKKGTGHWIHQRISAIALILLGPWFLYNVATETMTTYQGVVAWLDNPCELVLLICTLVVGLYHGALGLQVVIEDYVHTNWVKFPLLIIIKFSFTVMGAMAIYALISIKFFETPYNQSLSVDTQGQSHQLIESVVPTVAKEAL